jgi:hypothetical protein
VIKEGKQKLLDWSSFSDSMLCYLNAFLLIVHAIASKEGTDDGDHIECREPEISITQIKWNKTVSDQKRKPVMQKEASQFRFFFWYKFDFVAFH